MTTAFKNVVLNPSVIAPTGNPKYTTDGVDRAVYALGASHILSYLRAKNISATAVKTGFPDRLNNNVQVGTGGSKLTRNASDANFNSNSSIDLSDSGANDISSPFEIAGGVGLNQTVTTFPQSFTCVWSVHSESSPPNTAFNLFGTSDGFSYYTDDVGAMHAATLIGTNSITISSGSNGWCPLGATSLLWASWDNAALELRIGRNTSTTLFTGTASVGYAPAGGADMTPFGYQFNSGTTFDGQFEGFLWLNKAYMNGSNTTDDQLFTNLLAAWYALIG